MPWLTPLVFRQDTNELLSEAPQFGDGPANIQFYHIIHAYADHNIPENTLVQKISFDAIRLAKSLGNLRCSVMCIGVSFPEDAHLIPADVISASHLHRDITDVSKFSIPRRLPLLFDILKKGGEVAATMPSTLSDRDFIIFTNSDIHIQPTFYAVIEELIYQGYDVITVNRRTLNVKQENREFSPLFFAELGDNHPGFDCFVFPLSMMINFVISNCGCGAGYVMRSLLFNLVAHARRFLMVNHAHMTYHLGNDRYWTDAKLNDYQLFNRTEAASVLARLAEDPEKAARLRAFVCAHEEEYFRKVLCGNGG